MEHYYSMSKKELDWHFSPSNFAVTETSTVVDRTISVLNESKRNETINGIYYIYSIYIHCFFGRMPMHHMQSIYTTLTTIYNLQTIYS